MDNPVVSDQVQEEMGSCRLKFNSKISKRAPLFLTEFTNGRIKTNACERIKFDCYKTTVDFDKFDGDRKLFATNGHMNYSGASLNPTDAIKYYVGVRNKRNGKMKLYDSVTFRMRPDLTQIKARQQALQECEEAEKTTIPKTYWEEIDDLTENFGSKLKKRAMNARLKYKVDASLDDVINLDDLNLKSVEESPIQSTQVIEYLPSINRNASSAQDVFDVNDIISLEEDIVLEEKAQALLEDFTNASKLCSFVSTHLERGLQDFERAKYLIYYNYLVIFQNLTYREMQKRDPCPEMPPPFKQRIIANFTVTSKSANGRVTLTFPPIMKDKLLANMIILALLINEFYVNSNEILKDLRSVPTSKLVTIAQALGCHIKPQTIKGETVKFFHLTLPLAVFAPKYIKKK